MKLVRLTAFDGVPLWQFVFSHPPRGLRVSRCTSGYGEIYCLELKIKSLASYIPFTNPVAQIHDDVIEVFHPQYMSDIEDLVRAYEKETGREVLVKYWESA